VTSVDGIQEKLDTLLFEEPSEKPPFNKEPKTFR